MGDGSSLIEDRKEFLRRRLFSLQWLGIVGYLATATPVAAFITVGAVETPYPTPVPGTPVTLDGNVEYQTWIGFATVCGGDSSTDRADVRAAWRDLGFSGLRVMMDRKTLIDAGGDHRTPVNLGATLATNAALIDMSKSSEATRCGNFADWIDDNQINGEDRLHVHGYGSVPHWLKVATGSEVSHLGWDRCCAIKVNCDGVTYPTPWLQHFCETPQTGTSHGGVLNPTSTSRVQFARFLGAFATKYASDFGTAIDSISIGNEVAWENPYESASWKACTVADRGPLEGWDDPNACWHYYGDTMDEIKDYWNSEGSLTQDWLGGGDARLSYASDGNDANQRLWSQLKWVKELREHSDTELDGWLGGYNVNNYSNITTYRNSQVYDMYINGHAVAPGFPWWPWWLAQRDAVVTGLREDDDSIKPVYYTESGYNDQDNWLANGTSPGAHDALTEATTLHMHMTYGYASFYTYLTFARETNGTIIDLPDIASPDTVPKYVATKHYSRFIRPGAVRIKAVWDDVSEPDSYAHSIGGANKWDLWTALNIVAWKHDADNDLVIVVSNMEATPQDVSIKLNNQATSGTFSRYTSVSGNLWNNATGDLVYQSRQKILSLTVPAYSVTTLVDLNTP